MKSLFLTIIAPIAAIFSCRMLGLFMLIPVFTLYANQLQGATPTLIGVALGSYGLSQGLLQIPFGLLSDKYGRKPILVLGLILFAIGSLIGAFTQHIYGMILARIIQGMGAIGSVLIALLADLTSEKQRTLAMAMIGISIGLSFMIAFIVSPVLTAYAGLPGIFYLTVILIIFALGLLYWIIPTPKKLNPAYSQGSLLQRLSTVLVNGNLTSLNLGIFCQHFILTAMFYVLPLQLHALNIELGTTWHFYLPLLLLSFLLMLPIVYYSEKKGTTYTIFLSAVLTIAICQFSFLFTAHTLFPLFINLLIYFVAFNILEAMLPSLVSKYAPIANKGAALGIYSSSQFLGIFAGGGLAGILFQYTGPTGVFITNFTITFIWLAVTRILLKKKQQIVE